MKLQNVKTQTARFPEIKPLIKGVRPEDLVIHVEPLDKNALYRVIASTTNTVYDSARPGEEGLYEERVYRTERPEGLYVLVPITANRKRPALRSSEFLRHIAGVENPCPRIVVCRKTVWFETTERQLPVGSGRKTGCEVRIDVYLPPKSGMARLLEEADVSSNVRLNSEMLGIMEAPSNDFPCVGSMGSDLPRIKHALVRMGEIEWFFQFGAYLRGLREAVIATSGNVRVFAGKIGDFDLRVHYERSGATIVIGNETSKASFCVSVLEHDDPKIFLVDHDFTIDEAECLVSGFVKAWKKLYKPIPQPAMFGILRPTDNAPMA